MILMTPIPSSFLILLLVLATWFSTLLLCGSSSGMTTTTAGSPHYTCFHFTRVKLGSPPREFHLRIDTSSNIMWVNCNPCTGCPTTSGLGIELAATQTPSATTPLPPEIGSRTSGLYVSDLISFDKVIRGSKTVSSSANVVFGCSDYHSGFATQTDKAVDGIFGLGPHRRSVISQLAALGSTPNAFSHCLKGGDTGGGGTLVLGEIVEPHTLP